MLGRPLRISFALEKIRGAQVIVPRLSMVRKFNSLHVYSLETETCLLTTWSIETLFFFLKKFAGALHCHLRRGKQIMCSISSILHKRESTQTQLKSVTSDN